MAKMNGFSVFTFPGTLAQSTTVPHAFVGQRSTLSAKMLPVRPVDSTAHFEVPVEAVTEAPVQEASLSLESLTMLERGMLDASLGLVQPVPPELLLPIDEAE